MMAYTPPDPRVIRANLEDPASTKSFDARYFQNFNSEARRVVDYNVDNAAYIGARKIVDPTSSSSPVYSPHNPDNTPFAAIPSASNRKEHYEAIALFAGDDVGEAGEYFLRDSPGGSAQRPARGWGYGNNAANPSPLRGPNGESGDPRAVTQIPTSTTNPTRPRTVAAGYDHASKTLTVVFRDGTYYNYYTVPQSTWNNFRSSYSPGWFIEAHLDKLPRGIADASALTEDAREALYRAARTGQILNKGLTGSQTEDARRRKVNSYGPNLGGTGRKRAKLANASNLTGKSSA